MFNFFGRKDNGVDVTAEEVNRRRAAGEKLYVLDVREPAEYADARVAGSVLIPLGQLAQRVGELPKDRTIVAICASGGRSSAAVGLLKRAGFADVLNLRGGIGAWARSGLPIERGRKR